MRGINLSTALIATVIGLNYIFPEDAFSMVTATASATFIVIYISLLITHIQYRKSDHFINGQKKFLMPFAPFSNYLTILFMAGLFLILLFSPATMMTTILSIIWFVVLFTISLYKVPVR